MKSEVKRLQWKTADTDKEKEIENNLDDVSTLNYTINPMQIRTFKCYLNQSNREKKTKIFNWFCLYLVPDTTTVGTVSSSRSGRTIIGSIGLVTAMALYSFYAIMN